MSDAAGTTKRREWAAPPPGTIHVVPLGGLGEIGKNMWCVRSGDDIVVLDCGFAFPTDDMPGVDYVLPDYAYLEAHAAMVRGIFVSHGHEDHIGGLPFLLKRVPAPVFATPLTASLIEGKIQEHGLLGKVPVLRLGVRDPIPVGSLEIEFLRVSHSIPDSVAIVVKTPIGKVLYTGDFKFDPTPVDGQRTDYARLTALGEEGLLLLLSDSTNVTKPGFTQSEAAVGPALDATFAKAPGRLIVATFASNIHRVQQVIDAAARHGRKVAFTGRSMINVSQRANALGYLTWDEGRIIDIEAIGELPPNEVAILTTGSQGEPMAALSRIASSEHRGVRVEEGDTYLLSAIPIPGNERAVGRIVNQLFEKGATVIYDSVRQGTHVSGHASEEELKLMLAFTRPKFFVPVHGETRHLVRHADLGARMGVEPGRIHVLANGDVLELAPETAARVDKVPAGPVLVDGEVLWDVGKSLLKERQRLAQDGMVTTVVSLAPDGTLVAGPDMVTRGFIHNVEGAEAIMDEGKRRVVEVLDAAREKGVTDLTKIERSIVETLSRYFSERTRRKPIQLVVFQQPGHAAVVADG
jgi:ribonuclease J